MSITKETAVCVTNATKYYGNKQVLDQLHMNVEKGSIYGLLGASGCGKTTLLSCIVGRKKLDSGQVWVLGGEPGSEECGIPGPLVGYMPQDVALVAEFTIEGAIYYFGRIYGMSETEIEEKFISLSQLLELPPRDRIIKNCSGGQQRRVSFAAALVSSPQLLILDEPTVGLDPLLREKIWDYLVEITQKQNVAVIITTHYIEETRQAHKIGLMRQGKLLAEESPDKLLQKFSTDSLENVFLLLSRKQTESMMLESEMDQNNIALSNMEVGASTSTVDSYGLHASIDPLTTEKSKKKSNSGSNTFNISNHRIKALFNKNFFQIIRNPSGIAFMMMFPILEILAFFFAIGTDIRDIKIAVVNNEYPDGCATFMYNESAIATENSCNLTGTSCRFIEMLQKNSMFDLIPYDEIEKARLDITHGVVAGAIHIPYNFSVSLQERIRYISDIAPNLLNQSQISSYLDMSNRQIGMTVKQSMFDKMLDMLKILFQDCNYFPKAGQIPIKFEEPVYAHFGDTYSIFMTPGVLITILFFMGSSNASSVIISDRLEGVWDRSIVAGVSTIEIVITHFVTQFTILVLQTSFLVIITFAFYQVEVLGNFGIVLALLLLQGTCGMVYGFLISVVSNSHSMANIMATGTFYPMLFTCGLVWPIEGMPFVLRWISLCLPCTVPIIALRNVIKKGWEVSNLYVFDGILVELLWIIIFIIISINEIRKQR